MSRSYGKFKMRTAENTAYAERLRDLVDALEGEEVVAVYEYSSITSKYKPTKSAYKWLCEKRGQEIEEEETQQQQPDINSRIFAEMCELMTEMEYTPDERKKARGITMKYEKIQALKVPVGDGFSVLIVPDECLGHFCHTFYLLHEEYDKVIEMFGTLEEAEEQLVQIAIANAPDYIRQYLAE